MKQWILKQQIIEAVKTDQELFGKVAKILNVSPTTLPRILSTNSPKLTYISVLAVIGEHLKKRTDELIEIAIAA